ncbi:MAG: hypothetical protein RBS25_04480 [Bacilli bacterium]|jgi:hypothetical protein|nr:hypothetical protein [Bacilli bacterium]
MEEIVIAKKTNLSLLTKFITLASFVVFIFIPNEGSNFFLFLDYVLFFLIAVVLYFTIVHLLYPQELITYKENMFIIHRITRKIILFPKNIIGTDKINKYSRGMKMRHGTIRFYIRNEKSLNIEYVENVDEVMNTIKTILDHQK